MNLQKGRSNRGVPAASLMIKSVNKEEEAEFTQLELLTFPRGGSS